MVDFVKRNTLSQSMRTNGPIRGCVNGFSWFYFYLIETIELLNF